MRLLGNFRKIDVNMASDDAAALSESLEPAAITPIVARPRMRSRSEFHIQNLQIQSACPSACTCDCHKTWRVYSPGKLRKLFGYSKIEGAELPFFKAACGLRSCKGNRATFINIHFFLPTMMAARMISLWFTSSPLHGPELLLRVSRVLRTDTPAYRAICSGDLATVKRSVLAGDYKPWDVDYTGRSLILVCDRNILCLLAAYLSIIRGLSTTEGLRPPCILHKWLRTITSASENIVGLCGMMFSAGTGMTIRSCTT